MVFIIFNTLKMGKIVFDLNKELFWPSKINFHTPSTLPSEEYPKSYSFPVNNTTEVTTRTTICSIVRCGGYLEGWLSHSIQPVVLFPSYPLQDSQQEVKEQHKRSQHVPLDTLYTVQDIYCTVYMQYQRFRLKMFIVLYSYMFLLPIWYADPKQYFQTVKGTVPQDLYPWILFVKLTHLVPGWRG